MNRPYRLLVTFLCPAEPLRSERIAVVVVPLLVVSAVLIVLAAYAMPDGYSWQFHSISESAAQGQLHGWIARLAFICFGVAALLLAFSMRVRWPRLTYWCNLVFAFAMFGVAAFSHSPWQEGVAGDQIEDLLHSIAGSGMGTAFCVGVIVRLIQRERTAYVGRTLDVVALLAGTIAPAMLASGADIGGLAQRVMFAIAYIWFAHEALIAVGHVGKRGRE